MIDNDEWEEALGKPKTAHWEMLKEARARKPQAWCNTPWRRFKKFLGGSLKDSMGIRIPGTGFRPFWYLGLYLSKRTFTGKWYHYPHRKIHEVIDWLW